SVLTSAVDRACGGKGPPCVRFGHRVPKPGELSRRTMVGGVVGLAGAPLLGLGATTPFAHGVASGDPLPDRVVLWTRVSPPDGATRSVQWRVTSDPALGRSIATGVVEAGPDRDFTVHVDVSGLQPA